MPTSYPSIQDRRERNRNLQNPPFYPSLTSPSNCSALPKFLSQLYNFMHTGFSIWHIPLLASKLVLFLQASSWISLPERPLPSRLHYAPLLCVPRGLCTFSFLFLSTYYCNYSSHFLCSSLDHKLQKGESHGHLVHCIHSFSTLLRIYQQLSK